LEQNPINSRNSRTNFLCFAEESDRRYSVIDGQQRLTLFFSFVEEKFPIGQTYTDFTLTSLHILPELNKKKFTALESPMQLKIKSTALHTIIIKNDSDDEIRNSIYRGMVLRFLAFSEKTYINYRPSMKQFCNKELRLCNLS
jgi:uncharacterized protein with ParB-like and HNH nuclease domain